MFKKFVKIILIFLILLSGTLAHAQKLKQHVYGHISTGFDPGAAPPPAESMEYKTVYSDDTMNSILLTRVIIKNTNNTYDTLYMDNTEHELNKSLDNTVILRDPIKLNNEPASEVHVAVRDNFYGLKFFEEKFRDDITYKISDEKRKRRQDPVTVTRPDDPGESQKVAFYRSKLKGKGGNKYYWHYRVPFTKVESESKCVAYVRTEIAFLTDKGVTEKVKVVQSVHLLEDFNKPHSERFCLLPEE